MRELAFCGAALLFLATGALAGPVDDLSKSLVGREGKASIDHRQEEVKMRVFGQDIKGGCKGDAETVELHITAANGHLSGDTAAMDASYDGNYTHTHCGSDTTTEKKHVFGHYLFNVTSKPFQKLQVSEGRLAGIGESADPNDSANKLALEAVKNAVAGAF